MLRFCAKAIRVCGWAIVVASAVGAATSLARAADTAAPPEVVGVLALAVEGSVADQLSLTEEKRQQLLELIEARESEALELAIQLKNLPAAERTAKLAPFRRESESRGLALLNKQQRAKLQQIRVARWGLAGAVDAEVAEKLKLSQQQQNQVAELVREQSERLVRADEKTAEAVRAETDRKVASVLDPHQRAALQILAGAAAPREEAKQEKSAEVKPQEAAKAAPLQEAKTAPLAEAAKAAPPQEAAKTPLSQEAAKTAPAQDAAKTPPQATAKALAPHEAAKATPPQEPGKAAPLEAVAKTTPKELPPAHGSPAASNGAGKKAVAASDRLTPAKATDKLKFNFRYQPWKDVLDWFAESADLSLVGENIPKGTFNYTDSKEYTAAEAIDLLNSVLQTKGYTLVRKGRMLMPINLEDVIPRNLVETVPVEELDKRGQFEIVEVVFQLQNVSPEEAEQEINKLKGPQGSVTVLPKSRQLKVIETGGQLRLIRQAIQSMENPQGAAARIRPIELKYADPQDALVLLQKLLDISADKGASADGSVHVVLDPMGGRLLVTGKPDAVARVEEVVKLVDVPDPANPTKTRLGDAPQLEIYPVVGADPNAVLQVLQTLLVGMPEVRLSLDSKTGNIYALGRRAAHATIKATLQQSQQDARRLEVFSLRTLDPQLAVAALTKLFAKEAGPGAPTIDGDPYSKRLLVRGSEAQIEQIRQALQQMGESGTADRLNGGNLRVVPLTGGAARRAIEGLEEMWPTVRPNVRIRVVTPASGEISTHRSSTSSKPTPEAGADGDRSEAPLPTRETLLEMLQRLRKKTEAPPSAPAAKPGSEPKPATAPPSAPPQQAPAVPAPPARPESPTGPGNKSAGSPPAAARPGPKVVFAAQLVALEAAKKTGGKEDGGKEDKAVNAPADAAKKPVAPAAPAQAPKPPAAATPAKPAPAEPPKVPTAPSPKPATAETPKPAAAATLPKSAPPKSVDSGKEKPSVLVRPGPGGVIIASQDTDALDEIERLLTSLAGNFLSGKPELTVFYLKHAKANSVAETLEQIFGGGTSGGAGGSLMGDLASAALGDVGGGLLGTLLGGPSGGGAKATGAIQITPDSRLNALIVYAKPADLDTIEQLLKILDDRESPEEILAAPKPRLIPVFNTQAEEVANVVRQVYQDRMAGQAAGAGRPPTPQDFIMAMRNMRGGRGGGAQRGGQEEPAKLSISADPRTNSLVVVAPDSLFQEVKDLVEQLDEAAGDSDQTLEVVTLQRANSETIRQALSAMVGPSVQFGRAGTSSTPTGTQGQQPPPFGFGFSRRGFGSPFGFGGMGGMPGGGFPGGMGGPTGGFQGGGPSPFFSPFGGSPPSGSGGSPFSGSRGTFGPGSMSGGSFGTPGSSSRGGSGRRSGRSGSSSGGSRGR
jgi:type II secretory pathway component GspD/PulD (secretin)